MKRYLTRIFFFLLLLVITSAGILPQNKVSAQTSSGTAIYLSFIQRSSSSPTPGGASWVMAGANPQRTSRVSEEVRGKLSPRWYRTFEPYIAPKVQVVAANNNLYVSTARGLYALDAMTGADRWVFPTELPLGHSPTVDGQTIYVGGMDKNLYALDAYNGSLLWSFTAGAGFDTNPLVVNDKVYAGNRDGYFYAVYTKGPNTGKLAWRYKTDGPIHFSAAYQDGVVYFASDDSYAYALNASNGSLVWKSSKLPGNGFHSWWPVVYEDVVIFAGSPNYRTMTPPGQVEWISELDRDAIFPNHLSLPIGTLVGPRLANGWIDATKVLQYFEQYPHRRTTFILNRQNGREVTYNLDGDGKPEYAPFLWFGTHAGNRYPPIVGSDGNLYQSNPYASQPWGFRGEITGWKMGTQYINTPSANNFANDEPLAYSSGGNVIYFNLCCDRTAGGFDITIPNNGTRDSRREWVFFEYNLAQLLPGYGSRYHSEDIDATFGGANGVYGQHGDQNPPIPYQGMIFLHRSNTLIGFGPDQNQPRQLSLVRTESVTKTPQPVDRTDLTAKLENELEKMIQSGHLRPAYGISGTFDRAGRKECGDNIVDYFSNPSDSLYALLSTLPYLQDDLKQRVKAYIQAEYSAYPPYEYLHIGWMSGAQREPYIMPPEVDQARATLGPSNWTEFGPWQPPSYPPFLFYTLWKYAQEFGGARDIFNASKSRLPSAPSNDVLARYPLAHNSYIAGYIGYLNLESLAGYPVSTSVRNEKDRLINLRTSNFNKNSPFGQGDYCKTTNVARNFMYLVPELADQLRSSRLSDVQTAIQEYNTIAPYWFVNRFEATYGEGVFQPLYDSDALFKARALILKDPAGELVKYLDSPAFPVGDLFYIQRLVMLLAAQ